MRLASCVRSATLVSLFGACLFLSACDESSGGSKAEPIDDASTLVDGAARSDGIPADGSMAAPDGGVVQGLPAAGEWAQISPGGDTICSRGTPFSFFVRGGRPDRIIVDFRGGGACWNDFTCSVAGSIFSEQVDNFDGLRALIDAGVVGGVFDTSEESIFKDWTIVHIPYCTGDVHWGNAVHTYANDNVIHHKGYVNTTAALQWVYDRVQSPDNILVSGCSAGAYGAILHSAYIANHYLDSKVAVLADSGSGIITETFLTDSLPNWGAQQNIPPFIEALQRPISELSVPDLYEAIGAYFPQHRYAQTSTAFDSDQIFYYTAMGGDAADWPPAFQESISAIEAVTPNFRAYVPPGPVHCVTPYKFYATREVNGVRLADWVRDFIFADELPASQKCRGEDCYDDPVCDACAKLGNIWCGFCQGWPERFRFDEEMPDGGASTDAETPSDGGASADAAATDGGAGADGAPSGDVGISLDGGATADAGM